MARRQLAVAGSTLSIVALTGAALPAQIGIGSGLRADAPAASMKDLRDRYVVKQRFDFSCGAAALATLLRFGFGEIVTERDILTGMFDPLPESEQAIRRATGFSLLDLQRVAQGRGFNAQGFRLAPAQLSMLGGPVIVFIEPRGYRHFAVLRGVRAGRVHLADPSRGNIRMALETFVRGWVQDDGRGIIFVVEPKNGLQARNPLMLANGASPYPEIMTAREMLAVGNALVQYPGLSR